ncbi:NAD(P)-binding protein [Penicillium verhagenii]|uniref:NAD(P)-binding protein n=1 Tax=Penicillium verhagenii TaxID=1562060 RepID=UPI0025458B44|nr:NAD(P)-binding protein [Penicillium verhagenii]KAJ5921004.1 NAD(P)-binding protein [Penicillium verhagenii]
MPNPLFGLLTPNHQISIPTPLALGLGALGFVSLCSRINSYLSRKALNHGPSTRTWDSKLEIVVVTGGSSGIGAAIVELLSDMGVKTIILDINEPQEKLKQNTIFYQVDLSKPSQTSSVAAKLRAEHGDPTVLINNAGTEFNKPILELSESQLRGTFGVNILAHFFLVQEFLPAMVSQNHGHVVSVASLGSFTTSAINVDYACTKSAALAFYEGLGQELRHVYRAPGVRNS